MNDQLGMKYFSLFISANFVFIGYEGTFILFYTGGTGSFL
jgi:hypothetical protein